MSNLRIAIVSFPGNNCEVESMRTISQAGMEPVFCRWNGGMDQFDKIDGYFIPGGFSYEDRGRAGMVTARDPILAHIASEASKGKPVIGNCNGAQVLVESGLIPLGKELKMSLAHNALDGRATGFLNEWIWITPTCASNRCCTGDWSGAIHMPIAHGEGRFTTKDKDLYEELKKNDQLAFSYCDETGKVSQDSFYTPNGSEFAIAGICNPEGNVVALMPHPERTPNGNPYFASLKTWITSHPVHDGLSNISTNTSRVSVPSREPSGLEIFIDTIIVNNEERTVEQAARRVAGAISLKQLKYVSAPGKDPAGILSTISFFNPNKEIAYIRKGTDFYKWNADKKSEEQIDSPLKKGIALLRRDDPDTGAATLGEGTQTGVCYVCGDVVKEVLMQKNVLEIFGNPHASTLEIL